MSAIANIVVYDGAATPVSHTLIPISVTRNAGQVEALWREQLAGVPLYGQISVVGRLQKLKSGIYKVTTRVEVPVMESISGQNAAGYTAAPKVAYVNTVEMTGYFHERSDSVGRNIAKQIAVNLGNNVSTSVAASSSGPVAELFAQLTSPT
jgi:hypothetical protein